MMCCDVISQRMACKRCQNGTISKENMAALSLTAAGARVAVTGDAAGREALLCKAAYCMKRAPISSALALKRKSNEIKYGVR